jgi:hypothetical protein
MRTEKLRRWMLTGGAGLAMLVAFAAAGGVAGKQSTTTDDGITVLTTTSSALPTLGRPVGSCPSGGGWTLAPVFQAQAGDNGNIHDQNGDRWACRKPNPGKGGSTWKDNTNPLTTSTQTNAT